LLFSYQSPCVAFALHCIEACLRRQELLDKYKGRDPFVENDGNNGHTKGTGLSFCMENKKATRLLVA